MKKIIAIILALVMLMSFAACSASSDTTETPSTTPEASTQTEENASDVEVADESENEEFLVGKPHLFHYCGPHEEGNKGRPRCPLEVYDDQC